MNNVAAPAVPETCAPRGIEIDFWAESTGLTLFASGPAAARDLFRTVAPITLKSQEHRLRFKTDSPRLINALADLLA